MMIDRIFNRFEPLRVGTVIQKRLPRERGVIFHVGNKLVTVEFDNGRIEAIHKTDIIRLKRKRKYETRI